MKYFFLPFLILFYSFSLYAEIPIPELKTRVTDLSVVLTEQEKSLLENKLEKLEDTKGSQVAVLILPTTDGEPIEQFSLRVVETWKLGRKKINDGVLILVAKDDRKMRIEVGYGLEGILPDAICKRIISEQMRPNFKAQKFYEGIDSAVESISKIVNGEPLPPIETKKLSKNSSNSDDAVIDAIGSIITISFILLIFGSALTNVFASTTSGHWIGSGIFSTIGSIIIMGILSADVFSLQSMLIVGLISFIVFLLFIYWWSSNTGGSGSNGSSYSSWSSSSSDSSWSSSSSDSFSGGGGDFGGGGASGDW